MFNRYGISNVYVCMVDFCMTAGFDSLRTSDRCGGGERIYVAVGQRKLLSTYRAQNYNIQLIFYLKECKKNN